MELKIIKHNLKIFKELKVSEKLCIDNNNYANIDNRYWKSLRRTTDWILFTGSRCPCRKRLKERIN